MLHQGEVGVETDTDKAKLGDGATAWTSLAYWDPAAGGPGTLPLADGGTGVSAASASALLAALGAAPLASPVLTGSPTAPTQSGADSSTKLATTAFVAGAASAAVTSAETYAAAQAAAAQSAAEAASTPVLVRTAVQTANYTASANQIVPCDTTSASFTVTLPNAPAAGTVVAVKQVTLGTGNTVTVACAGSDVFNKTGGGTTGTLSLLAQGMLLHYSGAGIWTVLSDDLPLSQLDARYDAAGAATASAAYFLRVFAV